MTPALRRVLGAAGCAAVVVVLGMPCVLGAQTVAPSYRPNDVMIAGGVDFAASYPIGDVTADLRRNAPGPATTVPLFRAESDIQGAIGIDARVAVALTRSFAVEVAGTYSTPDLHVRISDDQEAGDASAGERLSQYAVDVAGTYLLPRLRLGAAARPYVLGGGGYLRQLHEGRLALETGGTIHVGGGVQFWLRGAAATRQRPFGGRVEARIVRRMGGIDFADTSRTFPTVSALLFVGF